MFCTSTCVYFPIHGTKFIAEINFNYYSFPLCSFGAHNIYLTLYSVKAIVSHRIIWSWHTGCRLKTLLLMLLLRLLNTHISLPFSNLSTGLRSTKALNINLFLLPTKLLQPVNLAILTIWPLFNPSQYPLLICCHSFSPTNHLLVENHRSLIQICITPSLESTPRFIPAIKAVFSLGSHPVVLRLFHRAYTHWKCN